MWAEQGPSGQRYGLYVLQKALASAEKLLRQLMKTAAALAAEKC